MRKTAMLSALLLTACATYSPEPLAFPEAESALAPPVADVLEARAGAIEREWLTPIAVDLSAPLTADAVAALAVANNPDLAALRARAGVSEAQVFAVGLLPDPTFSLGAGTVLSGPDSMADLSGALGFDLAALRSRSVLREQAVEQDRQVRLDLAWAEWQTAGQVRIQAVRIVRSGRIASAAQLSRDAAEAEMKRVSRAAGRGDIAGDRLQAARLALASANEVLRSSQQTLAAAQVELRRLLGLPPEFAVDLAEPEEPAPPPPSAELFALAVSNRTDLAALRAGYDAQEASVHKAVLDQFPNFGITLNTQRDSAGNLLVGPSVDLTLPLWNRNRGTIAVERATREALRSEYDARLAQTRADIASALAGIALAEQRRDEAQRDLPLLEQFAASSRGAASRGDLSLETAETAEQALRDRQIQLEQARQDFGEQMIALELLTGTPRAAWPAETGSRGARPK